METTIYYHKNSDEVAFERFEDSNGFSYECTYDEQGNELTYKDSNDYFRIKGEEVTEEEFNNFRTKKEMKTPMQELIDTFEEMRSPIDSKVDVDFAISLVKSMLEKEKEVLIYTTNKSLSI